MTVFLVSNPQVTTAVDPMTIAKSAMSVLGPIVNGYISHLRAKKEAESVKIRVWMHNGDAQLNGCGFYFRVDGYSGGSGEDYFPNYVEHKCGNDKYKLRMTSQSAMYDKKVHLGNEQAKKVEVHADGYHNTFINVICIGFNERTIAGGPRAFCINNDILKSCKSLKNQWNDINIEWNDIMLTRTNRGAHKIIFHEIEKLINGFEKFDRESNDVEALWTICNRIDLVKGDFKDEYWDCPAEKTWTVATGAGNFYSWRTENKKEDKNPYGCNRYTN